MDIKDISGILNLAAVSSSFERDYSPIKIVSLNEEEDSSSVIVLSLSSEDKKYLKINISDASARNMAPIIHGGDLELAPNVHKTFCNIANFAGIDFVVGYGEKFNEKSEEIVSSILVRQGNTFLSSEIPFGDLVCFGLIGNIPLYIRRVIFDKYGQNFENIKAKN